MNELMQVNGCPLIIREVNGQRVVTNSDIAALHKVSEATIRQNFKRHRSRFVEGVDYFIEDNKQSLRDNLSHPTNYFTETGYLMLVKSLNGDLAWQMQRALVNSYFRVGKLEKLLSYMSPIIQKVVYYRGLGLTQRETGKLLDMSKDQVGEIERRLKGVGYVAPNFSSRKHIVVDYPRLGEL